MKLWTDSSTPLLALVLITVSQVFGDVGDVLVESNFRDMPWKVQTPKGVDPTTLERNYEQEQRQNFVGAKDRGNVDWYFESPSGWLPRDGVSLYNGTLHFLLMTVEWTGSFLSRPKDFDVVLVTKKPKYSLGLKGLKNDGDTSRIFQVGLNETSGWQFVSPGKYLQVGGKPRVYASKQDIIHCLDTLVAIRIRGNYYSGAEKTHLRWAVFTQGFMADLPGAPAASPARSSTPSSGSDCCSDVDRACTSEERYEVVFNRPGLPCVRMVELSSGQLSVGSAVSPFDLVRLDPLTASPQHGYYTSKVLSITAGTGLGSNARVLNYVGRLRWEFSSGVTQVEVRNAGQNCRTGGQLAAVGGGGSGFAAQYQPAGWQVTRVDIYKGGVGCGVGARHSLTPAYGTNGAINSVAVASGGAGYVAGRLVAKCVPPCTGSGLVATCSVTAGVVTAVTVSSGGGGYSAAAPPVLMCPEATLAAVGPDGVDGGFSAVVGTQSGAIDYIVVISAGSYSGSAVTLRPTVPSTCVGFDLRPVVTGGFSQPLITILSPGTGYTSPPRLVLALGGIGDQGCDGMELVAHVGSIAAGALQAGAQSGGSVVRLAAWASGADGYYVGMAAVLVVAGAGQPTLQVATVTAYEGGSKAATLSPRLLYTVPAGAGYVLTQAPADVLLGKLSSSTAATALVGATTSALVCSCSTAAGAVFSGASVSACRTAGSTCATQCTCSIHLGTNAPADGLLVGETLYFLTGVSSTYGNGAAVITAYASQTATLAATGSGLAGFGEELGYTNTVASGALYASSASFLATLASGTNLNKTVAGSSYSMLYEDQSERLHAALNARPFLCDQPVSDNPPGPWMALPELRRTLGFLGVPLVAGAATLTVAAEARAGGYDEDFLYWANSSILVRGERGEVLGSLFTDPELFSAAEEGAPVSDSLALSGDKMLELTADGAALFYFQSAGRWSGQIRIRSMRLSFSPSAVALQRFASDAFVAATPAQGQANWQFNLSGSSRAGRPASAGLLSVTLDGHLSAASLGVAWPTGAGPLRRHAVWGAGSAEGSDSAAGAAAGEALLVSAPADQGEACAAGVCQPVSRAAPNRTRGGHHSARIPRRDLDAMLAAGGAGVLVQASGLEAGRSGGVKLSPATLAHALRRCHLETLTAATLPGPMFRQPMERPSAGMLVFAQAGPDPGGPGVLWMRAAVPPQPEPAWGRPPELGGVAVRAGESGELVGWLFRNDYSQYAPDHGVVDSLVIPQRMLAGLVPRLRFTLEVPVGAGNFRMMSAVIAYPLP